MRFQLLLAAAVHLVTAPPLVLRLVDPLASHPLQAGAYACLLGGARRAMAQLAVSVCCVGGRCCEAAETDHRNVPTHPPVLAAVCVCVVSRVGWCWYSSEVEGE